MPASPVYAPINTNEIESGDPITVSLGLRWAFNYLSVIQGSPSARAAGLGVWVQKSPTGATFPAVDAQTGIITDCLDPEAHLAPDGLGSVIWSTSRLKGLMTYAPFALHGASNLTAEDFTPTQQPGEAYCSALAGKHLVTGESASIVRLFSKVRVQTNNNATCWVRIVRVRGTVYTGIASQLIGLGNDQAADVILMGWDVSHADGDSYHVLLNSTESDTALVSGLLELTTF